MKISPKVIQLSMLILLATSVIFNFGLVKTNREVNKRYENASEIMNEQLDLAILHNKEVITQDVEEKYRADIVSYKALSKRAQLLREEVIALKAQTEKQNKEIEKLKKQLKKKRR